jgi:DNA polymerase-1
MIYLISKTETLFNSSNYSMCSVSDMYEYFKDKNEIQLDTETEGLDCHTKKIITIQLGDYENQYVIDFQSLSVDEFKVVKSLIEEKDCLLHNSKFDVKFLWANNIHKFKGIYDTMLAEIILNMGKDVEDGFYSLEKLCKRYCNIKLDKSVRKDFKLNDKGILYAASDVKHLSQIKEQQLTKLKELNLCNDDIYDINTVLGLENTVMFAYAMIEYNGMLLDTKKWNNIIKLCNDNVESIKAKLIDYIWENESLTKYRHLEQSLFSEPKKSTKLNFSSSQQKLELLKLIIPNIENTSERELSKYKNKHIFVKYLIEYSKANKLLTAFAESLPKEINPKTKRIHTNFWQILNTGRVSCSEPNLQQIPSKTDIGKEMRESFVAGEGKSIVGGDYSGCELRIIAEFSQDPIWVNAFLEDKDLHSELACKTFDIDISEVKNPTPFKQDIKYRDIQKTINFGLAYGMSEFKLADTIEVTTDKAKEIINKFFSVVPNVSKFLSGLGNLGKQRGYIKTPKPYSRIRWFSNWSEDADFKTLGEIERASKNTPIQGGNADLTKLATIYIYNYIIDNKLWIPNQVDKLKIIHQVHDEIQTEVDDEFAEEWKEKMNELMLEAGKVIIKTIPMKVDCKISKCWSK